MFKQKNIILILITITGVLLLISTVSAEDNITQNNTLDDITPPETTTNISTTSEPEPVENITLNPKVKIYYEDDLIAFQAPSNIFNNLTLWINDIDYGHSCDLIDSYGVMNKVVVKDNQGNIVAIGNITWNNLKFTLDGKTTTLNNTEYELLKQHEPVEKYVGVEKIKYISKYKKVKKTYYKTKLLGKAYKNAIGALVLTKIIGLENTVKYYKQVDKKLNKKIKKQIKKMKKKGWKFEYSYKKNKNGVYKVYGEFSKVKKVKTPVYKYRTENNYMRFKYTGKEYTVSVDSDNGKYIYTKSFELI